MRAATLCRLWIPPATTHSTWGGKGFTPAGALAIGNSIVTRAGPALSVKSLGWKQADGGYAVYNFVVEENHSYFVGAAGGGSWVHNGDCPLGELVPTHNITESNGYMRRLQASIGENGMLNAIKYVVSDGKNYIVDGNHRWYAARRLGLGNVPAQEVQLPYGGYSTEEDLQFTYYDRQF